MTVDEIRALINLASETGLAELEVQRGDDRVRIRRATFVSQEITLPQQVIAAGPVPQVHSAPAAAGASAAAPSGAAAAEPAKEKDREKPADPNLHLVKSPIVGTFYESPSPGAPAFVRLGERVTPGKVLCIIESMKLMNEIECEVSGIVENRLVMNGQPVEYGEAMFAIRTI
jgi:acetyl-CoA carboxylase biotin carboxyl carrier protein